MSRSTSQSGRIHPQEAHERISLLPTPPRSSASSAANFWVCRSTRLNSSHCRNSKLSQDFPSGPLNPCNPCSNFGLPLVLGFSIVRLKITRYASQTQHHQFCVLQRESMRTFLILLFGLIFVFMVVMTAHTQMLVSFWDFPRWQPQYAANPWAVATLWDAYFGFTTFFIWVCYKESRLSMRILWFVLIMALGNIAMSCYVLLQLFRLKPDQPVSDVVTRRA